MKLTEQQARKILREHGSYITTVCDDCGRPLGAVRYTRRGEDGEFCSPACRGDATGFCKHCGAKIGSKRRDSKWCSDRCRKAVETGRKQRIIPETQLILKGLDMPKTSVSHYPPSPPPA